VKQIPEFPVFDKRWLAVAPLSIAVGFIFYRWNVPAAWILAAILCAGGCALLTGRELTVRSEVEGFAKALIAMITAVPLIATPPQQLALFILPGLMVAAVTLVMSFAGGFGGWRPRRRLEPVAAGTGTRQKKASDGETAGEKQ